MRLLAAVLVLAGLTQLPAVTAQEVWPPAGVLTIKDGVLPPKIVTRTKPSYTREGVRQRIQGFVTLQFVVELDGTVGPVRVLRSLDAASGLDDAAVATLKQWRFDAGTKDGRPVRVMATVVMTFALRDLPPPMTLPQGFSSAPDSDAGWATSEVTSNRVHVQFQYPNGWQLEDSATMAVMVGRPQTRQSFGVYRPAPLPRPIPFPMPVAELMAFSEIMSRSFASQGKQIEVIDVGQSALGPTNWLWLELDQAEEGRAWAFTTSVGTQSVQVLCSVQTPRLRMTDAERDLAVAGARTDCSGIFKRMTFSTQ